MLFVDALRNVVRGATRILGEGHGALVAFNTAVPDLVTIRNIYEHFDEYVEGTGRSQRSNKVGPDDWRPLHTKVGEGFYSVRFGDLHLEVGSARTASALLVVTALEAAG
jgi:hypothetical protein